MHWLMTEQSERLTKAMAAASVTRMQAVERWGWNANSLKSNMNGNRPFGFKRAMVYAARLKVRAEWLYEGIGEMRETRPRSGRPDIVMPVISWVSAGQLAEIGDLEQIDEMTRITVSGLPAGEYFATEVRGDSMDRVSPDGSTIIVRVDQSRPLPGGFYVFSVNGETVFKRYYDDPIVRFEPFSTNPANRSTFPLSEQWVVVGQVVRSFIDLDRG